MKKLEESGEVLRMEDELLEEKATKKNDMTSRTLPQGEEEEDQRNLVSTGSKFMEIVSCPVCYDVPFSGTRMW
jgi:hypothetical protein